MMADQMKLSQAEIDALLNGTSPAPESDVPNLTDAQKDMLGEIGNISFGTAATSLSTLLQQRVEITTPTVFLMRADDPPNDLTRPYVMVSVEFTEGLRGTNALAIHIDDAKTIADLMLGGDGTNTSGELNELHLSAVGEAMNQMMGSAATSMATIFSKPINISPPIVRVVDLASAQEGELPTDGWIVNVSFRLRVGTLIDSSIMQLVPLPFAREIIEALNPSAEVAATAAASQPRATSEVPSPATVSSTPTVPPIAQMPMQQQSWPSPTLQPETAPAMHAINGYAQPQMPQNTQADVRLAQQPVVQRAEFTDFSSSVPMTPTPRNLALLFDVPLNVTVELGRTKRAIRDILELAPGSIIELDKLAGEPVDILVNNKRIAIGEVVVIDENFGVRVTDIVSPAERVKNLQ